MIPALNEEDSIGEVIENVPIDDLILMGYDPRIAVVDGRSTDRTLEIAREKGANIIIQRGKGKGVGVRQALSLCNPQVVVPAALSLALDPNCSVQDLTVLLDCKYVVMMDADGTYPPKHIIDIVQQLENGAEVVMGSRFKGDIEDGAMTPLNHLGNVVLSGIASILYFHGCSDLCTGMWGFSSRAIDMMDLDSNRFELEAEMFAESVKNKLKIAEVPIEYKLRAGDTKLSPLLAGTAILGKLVERRFWNATGKFEFRQSKSKRSGAPNSISNFMQ